jgi:hypothetical protein
MISRKPTAELVTAILVMVLALIGLSFVWHYPDGSRIMPVAIMISASILAAIWAMQLLLSGRLRVQERPAFDPVVVKRLVVMFASLLLMLAGISTIGFFSTYVVLIPATAWLLGYQSPKGLVIGTVVFCAGLYLVFKVLLNRPLPLEIWMLGA